MTPSNFPARAARVLGLIACASLVGCGQPIEAPFEATSPSPVGAGQSDAGAAGRLPNVLFPTTVILDTPERFGDALGLAFCKLQYACCGLSLSDANVLAVCGEAVDDMRGSLRTEIEGVASGSITFDPEAAGKCASDLLAVINGAIERGLCELELDSLSQAAASRWDIIWKAFMTTAGLDSAALAGLLAQCGRSVFRGRGSAGAPCTTTDTDGDSYASDEHCLVGLYCFEPSSGSADFVCARYREPGETCLVELERCVEDYLCVGETAGAPGTCVPTPAVGEPCLAPGGYNCGEDLECVDGRCALPDWWGEVGDECLGPAECQSGVCDATLHLCIPSHFVGEGADCENLPGDTGCDVGLVCDEGASPATCVRPTAAAGEPCSRDAECLGQACLSDGRCARTVRASMCDAVGDLSAGVGGGP